MNSETSEILNRGYYMYIISSFNFLIFLLIYKFIKISEPILFS